MNKIALTSDIIKNAVDSLGPFNDRVSIKGCVYSMEYLVHLLDSLDILSIDTCDLEYNGWQNDFYVEGIYKKTGYTISVSGSLYYNDLEFYTCASSESVVK